MVFVFGVGAVAKILNLKGTQKAPFPEFVYPVPQIHRLSIHYHTLWQGKVILLLISVSLSGIFSFSFETGSCFIDMIEKVCL